MFGCCKYAHRLVRNKEDWTINEEMLCETVKKLGKDAEQTLRECKCACHVPGIGIMC